MYTKVIVVTKTPDTLTFGDLSPGDHFKLAGTCSGLMVKLSMIEGEKGFNTIQPATGALYFYTNNQRVTVYRTVRYEVTE